MVLQDLIGSNSDRVLGGEQLGEVDRFSYLDSYISRPGRISDEVSFRIQKAD